MIKTLKTSCLISAALGIVLLSVASSCGEKREASAFTDALVGNLQVVNKKFTPQSLTYSTTSGADFHSTTSNPCAGYDLFGCQPVLLRLYVSVAKQWLDIVENAVSDTGPHMSNVAVGASGTVDIEDGQTLEYSRTGETSYKMLVKNNGTSSFYVDVDNNDATIQINGSEMGAGSPANVEIKVSFTDEDHWSLEGSFLGMPCNSSDVRAPERFHVLMAKDGDLWKGKAMMYNGVWASFTSEPTCSTTATDDYSTNFYTDFVGDDTAAKANVYALKRNVSAVSGGTGITDYPLSAICTTYGTMGGGELDCAAGMLDSTQYANSFCNPASTDIAVWNNNCSTYSSAVSSASFGDSSEWILPSDFYVQTITLPTSL